ncbi:MAG: glycosyltransferase [Acidobacteria bacterium]|nr:glycosyltransferase [Acidobacteriota bacterium]
MKLSVVIPTKNRPGSLARVLAALTPQLNAVPGGAEALVVDDGSEEPAEVPPGVVLLRQEAAGPAVARNAGAARAQGEVLLFLGDDTEPEAGFLAAHAAAHAARAPEQIAVLGFTSWDAERVSVTPFLRWLDAYGAQFGYALLTDPENVPFRFFYTSNVSLPRRVFQAVGGFDTSFPEAAWEDVELAFRIFRERPAFRMVYEPRARARHDHPTDLPRFRARQYRAGRAAAVLVGKHPELESLVGAPAFSKGRPFSSVLAGGLVSLVDGLGVSLPGRIYAAAIGWDAAAGLRDGLLTVRGGGRTLPG